MKKIGITQRLDLIEEYGEVRSSLDIKWIELLESLNFLAIPLSINKNLDVVDDLELDGIILTGGNSLASQSNDKLSILRDEHEFHCISYAIKKSIPIFGTCRGMQILAEYFGSTLIRVKNHVGSRHEINIVKKTNLSFHLEKIYNVNSYHNFAIDKLARELQSIAVCSKDKTIEAFQHRNYRIFGQMWHPERETPFNKYNSRLITEIFNA